MRENVSLQIEEFLKDDYQLFAIMGVFGALSVYLTTLPNSDDLFFQIGIVASFTLFILVSLLILLKGHEKFIDMSSNVSLKIIVDNFLLGLFIFPLYLLVFTIAFYIFTSFSKPLEIFGGLLTLVLGTMLSFGFLIFIEFKVKNKILYIVGLLFISVISIIAFNYILDGGQIILIFFLASIIVVSSSLLLTKSLDLILSIVFRSNK